MAWTSTPTAATSYRMRRPQSWLLGCVRSGLQGAHGFFAHVLQPGDEASRLHAVTSDPTPLERAEKQIGWLLVRERPTVVGVQAAHEARACLAEASGSLAAACDTNTALAAVAPVAGAWHSPGNLALAENLTPACARGDDDVQCRQAAQEGARTRAELLAIVAHDLKTPLTIIKGYTQILQRRAADDPARARDAAALATIAAEADRMHRLLDRLLVLVRSEPGRALPLHLTEVDLRLLVERHVERLRMTANHHTIQVQGVGVGTVVGRWDSDRLEQVIGNLLSNATKYSPAGSVVTVTVGHTEDDRGGWALLVVQDRGVGIPAVDLPHVFKPYHRGRNVAGHIPGTGVGLAGARRIVEQHGGTITVESREGTGATFTVRLPLHTVVARVRLPTR